MPNERVGAHNIGARENGGGLFLILLLHLAAQDATIPLLLRYRARLQRSHTFNFCIWKRAAPRLGGAGSL